MYRIEPIIASWRGLIAWRQNYDPNGAQLEPELTTGESKMYYQDEHPMLTLDNLKSIMPDYTVINYPAWAAETVYSAGDIVALNGVDYEALVTTTAGASPAANPTQWKLHNAFSNWIRQKTEAGIVDTVNNYLERKELLGTAKTLLENKTIFDGIGRLTDTVTNRARRAGFEIVTSRTMGLSARLDRIGVQFTAPSSISIHLHHSSQETPLKSLILPYTKSGGVEWFDLGWDLPTVSEDTDSGGAYYVTYKQSSLTGVEAIRKERTWNEAPCQSCATKTDYATWKVYSPLMELHPFTVPETEGENLWDIEDNRYEYDNNFGINFAVSIYCDYTDFLINQRDLFKSALRKQVAVNLLREMVYNPNSQITQGTISISKDKLLYEIDGDTRGRNTGLAQKYQQALDAIILNTKGLNRVCLPCGKKGVRYRAI